MIAGLLGLVLLPLDSEAQRQIQYTVSPSDIQSGYVTLRLPLTVDAEPQVRLVDYLLAPASVPEGVHTGHPEQMKTAFGRERKQPFVWVQIPAYTDKGEQLVSYTLELVEAASSSPSPRHHQSKTTAQDGPLAQGNWYRLALVESGIYRLSYPYLQQHLGLDPAQIQPDQIRIFGKGGAMLPEKNIEPQIEGLSEIAIDFVDKNGNRRFDPEDYVVFYGQGIMEWSWDSASGQFIHQKNLYEEKGYYFLNLGQEKGARVARVPGHGPGGQPVYTYQDRQVWEEDLYNPGRLGKKWWGPEFGKEGGRPSTRSYPFTLGAVSRVWVNIGVGSRSSAPGNRFSFYWNGQHREDVLLGTAGQTEDDVPVAGTEVNWEINAPAAEVDIRIDYSGAAPLAVGYLDHIRINSQRQLGFDGPSLLFRQPGDALGETRYYLKGGHAQTRVWEITDPRHPVQWEGQVEGQHYVVRHPGGYASEWAAWNSDDLPEPEWQGPVENQNLYGHPPVDYVIVSHESFLPAAQELADFHRETQGLRVLVTTPQKIYNEFSSGGQDISAIRDFLRHLYIRASRPEDMPRYLLLLGDASYDYKDRVPNNTNFVPTFESRESFNVLMSYCNDDFFGMLDQGEDLENLFIPNTLDIGIGRFPVSTLEEAQAMVRKVKHYKSPASLGPWRLSTTLIADDEDNAGPHLEDGEVMEATIKKNSPIYNTTKIYQDAIETISTPGGRRAPEANKAINDQVFKGTLLINYNGHGNAQVLSHERILTQDDYLRWDNLDRLPFLVTATCDYGRFDHPETLSSGERLPMLPEGGVIATLTTTQLVYQDPNRYINRAFLDAQFQHNGSQWNSFGDALRMAKNEIYRYDSLGSFYIVNARKFALLGDPALLPNFPEHFIYTDSIIEEATGLRTDTLGALGAYEIRGYVGDAQGNPLTGFQGQLSTSLFDKPRRIETTTAWGEKSFHVQNNLIYKGRVSVVDGRFSIRFIAPRDLNFDYGHGKISYYAEDGREDGAGADTSLVIGGFSDYPVIENNPPIVKPFIGDTLFVNGGLTGSNTLLYVQLEDETGINVSGNSVGHDLVAILNGDLAGAYILNDYYESAPNTYKKGSVSFPLVNLPEGRHRITVKAWDMNNNSGTGHVDFEVRDGKVMAIQNLMNYPNPFRERTHFRFEHNHPGEVLKAEINIFNSSGVLVRRIRQEFQPSGSHSQEISWDGKADNGAILPNGVYIYRMKILVNEKIETTAYQKLVILR